MLSGKILFNNDGPLGRVVQLHSGRTWNGILYHSVLLVIVVLLYYVMFTLPIDKQSKQPIYSDKIESPILDAIIGNVVVWSIIIGLIWAGGTLLLKIL